MSVDVLQASDRGGFTVCLVTERVEGHHGPCAHRSEAAGAPLVCVSCIHWASWKLDAVALVSARTGFTAEESLSSLEGKGTPLVKSIGLNPQQRGICLRCAWARGCRSCALLCVALWAGRRHQPDGAAGSVSRD